jgi:hypothetical protein
MTLHENFFSSPPLGYIFFPSKKEEEKITLLVKMIVATKKEL